MKPSHIDGIEMPDKSTAALKVITSKRVRGALSQSPMHRQVQSIRNQSENQLSSHQSPAAACAI